MAPFSTPQRFKSASTSRSFNTAESWHKSLGHPRFLGRDGTRHPYGIPLDAAEISKTPANANQDQHNEEEQSSKIHTGYKRSKGWILETADGNTSLWFGVRLQLRATNLKGDPVVPESVVPDTSLNSNLQQEWTLGANWFFKGHRNKITADVSQIILDAPNGEQSETRIQVQWDVSF